MKTTAFLFVFLIVVLFISGCAIFNLSFFSDGGEKDLAEYCKISFLNPNTKQPFTSPITFPASVVIKYEYTGYYPAEELKMDVVQVVNDRNWLSVENLNPKSAMVNFENEESAGDFLVRTQMRTISNDTISATKLLHIIDPFPATITEFEFHLTDSATLIPEHSNNAFLWMKIEDDESILFSKSIVASLNNRSKLYINGRNMNASGFPPESAIVSDDGKQVICIALLNIQANNAVLNNTPNIKEGENDFRFVFEGFNVDGSGLIEKKLKLNAVYPDTTPPEMSVDLKNTLQTPGSVDFSVTDEFAVEIDVKDKADKSSYTPSGLKDLKWEISGEGGRKQTGTIDLSGLDPKDSYHDYIQFRLRESDFESGIYRLKIIVEDRNGNKTNFGPKIFSYNVTNFVELDISMKKIDGNMVIEDIYYAGESARFIVETDKSIAINQWEMIPNVGNKLVEKNEIKAADYLEMNYGNHTISFEGEDKGIIYLGSLSFSVNATQGYIPGPTFEIDEAQIDFQNPGKPFVVTVKSLIDLPSDPMETLEGRVRYYNNGTIAPARAIIKELNATNRKRQSFNCYVTTPEGTPVYLEGTDRLELTFVAKDAEENEREYFLMFPND